MMETQLALASLMQVAYQASALLISVTQQASASLVVQRALASVMALVVSDLFWQKAGKDASAQPQILTGTEPPEGSDHLVQHHLEHSPVGTPERRCPLV